MAKNRGQFNGGRGMNLADRITATEKEKYNRNMNAQLDFLLQIGCDAYVMSCADLFDLQPGRAAEAVGTYRKYIYDLMDHMIEDAKDDPENVYFWGDLDRRLEQICGPAAFVPKDERYDVSGQRVFNHLLAVHAARLKLQREREAKEAADGEA